jgi:phospholipase C
MGAPCGLTSHGRYAAKHNPFAYFDDINGWDGKAFHPEQRCNAHVVDYAQLDVDIANNAVPRYVFITPNLDSDMHDGSVALGDSWLAKEVPKLLATDAYKNGGVIFLMWDEGGGSPASDDPPFLAISPERGARMHPAPTTTPLVSEDGRTSSASPSCRARRRRARHGRQHVGSVHRSR